MDLQEELGALGRRQRSLEDQELEIMEELEPIEADLASLTDERAVAEDDLRRLDVELVESEAAIDAELAELAERRLAAMAPVGPEVLDEYERLRTAFGGHRRGPADRVVVHRVPPHPARGRGRSDPPG